MAPRLILAVVFAIGLVVAALTDSPSAGAPADAIDAPTHIDVTAAGEILLGFQMDVADVGAVRRLSADGAILAAWTVAGPVDGLAWDRASGALASNADLDQVAEFSLDGTPMGGWTIGGLLPDLAVGTTGRSLLPSIYVLVEGAEWTEVVRESATGGRVTSWPVIGTPYALAWSPVGGAEGMVQVAVVDLSTPAGAIVVSYDTDGRELGDWSVDGDVRGLDVDSRGRTLAGVLPERSLYGRVAWYNDGDQVATCDLPGYPVDVAADPGAGAWVIVMQKEGARSAQLGNSHRLMHFLEDCTVTADWPDTELGGPVVTPTPPVATPGTPAASPSQMAATPDATGTPAASGTPTPVGWAYLPSLLNRRPQSMPAAGTRASTVLSTDG